MERRQTASPEVEDFLASVDRLLSANLTALTGPDLTAAFAALETGRRRLEAVDQLYLAQIAERGIAGEYGRTDPTDLMVTMLRVAPAEARARVARTVDLGPRRTVTGEPLEPILPEVSAAVREGEISAAHVSVITDALDRIPPRIADKCGAMPEQFLVEAARHENPKQLRRTAAMLLARLDPDGIEPRDDENERNRGFSLRKHKDGMSEPRGLFTPELTAMFDAVLDALAAPLPAESGEPDLRTPEQRRHDGIAEALHRLLDAGSLPSAGGTPVTILVRTTMSELASGVGIAVTGHGDEISISKLLQMSSDALLIPVICNDAGGVLAYGRKRRLASRGQRLALAARDGGCCFPGCSRPAAWTEVHHINAWIHGGHTDLGNMCLLCRYHHREFAGRGWEVLMIDGVPWWRPPAWIDPERIPIRNTAHHVDIRFSQAS
jgi:hypothetical protein